MYVTEERKAKIDSILAARNFAAHWDTMYKQGKDKKVIIECLVDGEKTLRDLSHLTRNNFKCDTCLDAKYAAIVKSHGFKFIKRKAINTVVFVEVVCEKDGTILDIQCGNVLHQKNIHCPVCDQKLVTDSLEAKGCKYLSTSIRNQFKFVTYLDSNGDQRTASRSNIIRDNFASSESHWDQKHSVYLIENVYEGITYFKIGTANVPENRVKALKLIGAQKVATLKSFESRKQANELEQQLHKRFNDYRLPKQLAEVFTRGLSKGVKSGITEWFSKEAGEILKQELNIKL